MDEYVCDPSDAESMIAISDRLWSERKSIIRHLQMRIPQIMGLARKNFALTRMVYEKRHRV